MPEIANKNGKWGKRRAAWLLFGFVLLEFPLFFILAEEDTSNDSTKNTQEIPQEERWYRSNQLGMALELLENPRDWDVQEWGLKLESNSQQRLKTLYYQGQPRETWLLTYRNGKAFQEQHKRYGTLLTKHFFDEDTAYLSEINSYSADILRERLLFFYNEDGHLMRSQLYDENGQLLRESTFRLDDVGQLIKLNILRYDKPYDLVQYQLESMDIFIQNGRDQGRYLIDLFDDQRRNTSQIVYLDNVVAKRSNFEYSPDGKLERAIVTELQRTSQYDYSSAGRLLQKQVWDKGILSETEVYRYDKLSRLINKKNTLWMSNRYSEERLSYQMQSQDLKKIEFYTNDEIDKIRFYTGLYSYYEELYFDGRSVAKVYYDYDDELYTEVTFQNMPEPEEFVQSFSQ